MITPEQVRTIVEQVLASGVGLHWATYAGLAILYAGGLFVAPMVAAFLTEHGKNLATKHDVDLIVAQVQQVTTATEAIKTELAGGLWLQQKRWELRREIYTQLLTELHTLLGALRDRDAADERQGRRNDTEFDDAQRRVIDAHERVSSAKVIGQAILIPEAVSALETFRDAWVAAFDAGGRDQPGALERVVAAAVLTLRDVARRDLLAEARKAGAS